MIETLPLDANQSSTIETQYGSNKITVEDGAIYVEAADCHGGDCIRLGRISRPGQMIVCLPHHLVITIQSNGGAEDPDVVIR